MSYALGMNQNGGCACGTPMGQMTTSKDGSSQAMYPGLHVVESFNSDIVVDQGTTQEMLMCFVQGNVSEEIQCVKKDGTLQFAGNAKLCFKAGDRVRVVNFDKCYEDAPEIYQVEANPLKVDGRWTIKLIATPADAAATPPIPAGKAFVDTIAGLEFDTTDLFCFMPKTEIVPIGCVQPTKAEPIYPPRLLLHRPAGDMVLTGAVSYRNDFYDEFGVTYDGTDWAVVSPQVTGIAMPGDYITSPDANINEPIRILEVRPVTVMNPDGTGTMVVEKWHLERKVDPSKCSLTYVRRGTTLNFETYQDGDCVRIIIPSGMTSGLQLNPNWQTDGLYNMGRYTITATWATLRGGKLAPRTEVIRSGNLMVRPTHHFSVTNHR